MSKATSHASLQHDTTLVADTTSADSVAQEHAVYQPRYPQGLPQIKINDSVNAHAEDLATIEIPMSGTAKPFDNSPLHDTGSMSLLLAGLLLIIVSYRTGYKYIESFAHNIFSAKMRENLFDDHTVTETQILTALIFNTCVMEGFLMFFGISYVSPTLRDSLHDNVFAHIGIFSAIALVFYLLQLGIYALLGYVFATKTQCHIWLNGFKASQSLLGLLLLPVVVIMLVYPSHIPTLLTTAAALYAAARVVFIAKGFRIFFNDLTSIPFFILYLCSIEIVPPILVYLGVTNICLFLQGL